MVLKSEIRTEALKDKKIGEKFPNDKIFDVNNAYRITKRLTFPRLIGSNGEKKAKEIVLDEFKKAGYNSIYRDCFKTSFYNLIVLRYVFIPMGICLILLSLSFSINYWLTLGLILTNLYIAKKVLGLATTDKIHLLKNEIKNYQTENIFTELKNKDSKKTVVFIAHWDSKSLTFSSYLRIFLFLFVVIGFFILIFLYLILTIIQLIFSFNNFILNRLMSYCSILVALASNLNYFNKTKNYSPGAYDNAAAVGTVIELARYYKNKQLENIDFIFLCTSSEELNLGGAKYFIQKYKNKLDKNSTYFINLDLIGGNELIRLITSFGIPRKVSSKILKKLFLKGANRLNIKLKDVYLPTGAWSDYMPIVQQGFEACWLGSQPGLKYVHTKHDDIRLIYKEGLINIFYLCEYVINKLNTDEKTGNLNR
ncbi:MAG: M28 family peptidase [Candidatus Thorarchaeota archaeon]